MMNRRNGYPVIRVIDPLRATLDNLAWRVERLTPSPRNPERFHEDKSEIIAELHRLASEAHHG